VDARPGALRYLSDRHAEMARHPLFLVEDSTLI